MSLLDVDSEARIAAMAQAPDPLPTKTPAKRFSTWGMFSAAPKGVVAGAAEGAGSTSDILGAFGQAFATTAPTGGGMFATQTPEERKQTNAATDKLLKNGLDYNSEAGRSFRNVSAGYTPDAQTTHVAESAVFNLFRVGSKALTSAATLGNIPGAVVAGIEEGFTQADMLGQQGVDEATRTKVGAVTAVTNAVGFALPAAGKTWLQTGALALAGGPVSFVAQNAATREILQAADYSKLADQYDPLDPVGLALSTMLPLGFGALAMRGAKVNAKGPMPDGSPPPDVPPDQKVYPPDDLVDAARVSLIRQNMDGTNPVPDDLGAADAHIKAYTQAMDQQAAGERVSVGDVLPEAVATQASQGMAAKLDAAIPAAKIPRDTNLNAADRAIESNLADKVANDFPAAVAEYNARPGAMGGKVLNTDVARELSPEYMADRTKSAAVHEPSSYFIKQLYAEKLATLPKGDTVLFTSGGTGAGKTTAVDGVPQARQMFDDAGLVYDTNMNTLSSAVKKIEQALEAGQQVQIIHVQRDPVDALVNGALPRALRQAQEFGTGRTVPLREHARTHIGAAQVIQQLAEKYKDDPRVGVNVLDNTKGKGGAVMTDLEFIKRFDYTDTERRLYDALQQQYDAGAIPESIFRATQGDASPGVGQVLRANGATQPESQRAESGFNPAALATQASDLLSGGKTPGQVIGELEASGATVSPELQNMLIGASEFGGRINDLVDQVAILQKQRGANTQPFDLIAQAVENLRTGQTVDAPKAANPLDARLADIEVRNPTALSAEIAFEFDDAGKPINAMTAREYLDMVKKEAAQDSMDAGLIEVAANCFLSGGM